MNEILEHRRALRENLEKAFGVNNSIDPDAFLEIMPEAKGTYVGTKAFLQELQQEFPQLVIGSFSHYVE